MPWIKKNSLILFFALLTLFLLFPIIPVDADIGGPAINDSIEAPCDSGGFSNDNCTAPNELPTGEQVAIITNYTVDSSDAINNDFCLIEDGNPANCSSLGGGTLINDDCTDNGDIFYITGTPEWTFPSEFGCSYDSSTGKILCDRLVSWSIGDYYYINWTLEACSGDRGSSSDIYSECGELSGGIPVNCDSVLLDLNITNAPPTHSTPAIIPDPTSPDDNITCTNQSTSDPDNDTVTNIYNWLKDGTSLTLLNMPFDTNVSDSTPGAVRDYSGYNNNGTLKAYPKMPAWTTEGKLGGAYDFNGSEYLVIPKTSTLNNTYNFTISLWIKPNDTSVGQRVILTNEDGGTAQAGEFRVEQSGNDVWYKDDNANIWAYERSSLTAGAWNHISIVMIADTNVTVYVNGVHSDTADTSIGTGPYMNGSNQFYVGTLGDESKLFNGTIDDLRIYNISLTPSQIKQIYKEGNNNYTNSTIVSQETVLGENWTCEVTPNDAIDDGITKSNSTIIGLCNPPTDSDWDISIPVICQDKVIYLAQDKNLNIMNGGSLTLLNTTLWINQTSDDGSGINVQSGGAMNITDNNGDGSLINSTNGKEFAFNVDSGSNFSMTNSRLEECGNGPLNLGLRISTTVTEFSGNTLTNNYYGVVFYSDNNIIANNTINSNNDYGISLSYSDNNTISNNTIFNNNNDGIYLDISNNNTISDNNISSNNNGIYFSSSNNNTLTSNILDGNTVNIYFYSHTLPTWGNIVIDSVLTNPSSYDIQTAITLPNYNNNTLLNTTFNKSVSLEDDSVIYVKWYLDVFVKDIHESIIENANVTAWDNSNNLAFSELTGSDGYIQRQNVTEYFENGTGKYFLTNYTINTVSPCCESDSRSLNLTESTILTILLTPFYTLYITLNINNTDNTVYIPVMGVGAKPASQLGPGANHTNQTHNYLASYNSTSLTALAAQTALRLFVSNTTTYHTIRIEQLARNSRVFLVFTKGDWQTIDNRMNLIEAGQFLAKISPSFAFGFGITYPIKLLLSYSDIDIQGDIILQSGRQGLIVNYSETINDTPVIFIRRI